MTETSPGGGAGDLDAAFYEAFVRATDWPEPEDLEALRALAARGAGTSAFDDYELGPENFGSVVKEWLTPGHAATHDARVLAALQLCVAAGPAFATNRGYVGNGGVPAIWFVLERLAQPEEGRGAVVVELLETLCAAAPPEGRFWRDHLDAFLFDFLARLERQGAGLSELQRAVAQRSLERVLAPRELEATRALWLRDLDCRDRPLALCRALIGIGDLELLELALELATGPGGVAPQPLPLVYERAEPILKSALRSKRSRATLAALLRRSSWLREALLGCPELVLSLAPRRERKLLEVLLELEPERVRALRDREGNGLLHLACRSKGRTEKLASLLLGRGFDPAEPNAAGESPLDLAQRAGDPRLLALLSSRPPRR